MNTENEVEKKSIYSRGFRLLVWFLKLFDSRWRVEGEEIARYRPCLFVSRHLDNIGPVALFLQMPVQFRLWVLADLIGKDENYAHLSGYTFSKRLGYPMWLSKLLAWIICGPAHWVFMAMDAIPVYRGSREMVKTTALTLEALKNDQNVMILTDKSYTNKADSVGELYSGFIHIAKKYRQMTGKDLHIVPVLPDKAARTLRFSAPLIYCEEAGYAQEKERLLALLTQTLSLPEHEQEPLRAQGSSD